MNWISKIIRHIEETVAAVLLGLMVVIVAVDVFGRYVLNHPLQGAGEAALLLFVWQVFLGSAAALGRGLHVGIEFVVDRFPMRLRAIIDLIMYAFISVTVSITGYMGWELALDSFSKRFQMLDLPYTYALLGIPAGCFLMSVHLIATMGRAARGALRNTYRIERKGFEGTGCVMPDETVSSSQGT